MVIRKQKKVLVKYTTKKSLKVDFQRTGIKNTTVAHEMKRKEEHKLIYRLRDNDIKQNK